MFKRYGPKHWGLFIPIGPKKLIAVWDPAADEIRAPTYLRRHLTIAVKYEYMPGINLFEIRFRVGPHYL